jgi:ribosomal protein S18 acetylase RimI-like enzyme
MTIREAETHEAEAVLDVWRAAAEATSTDNLAAVSAAIDAHHAAFLVADDGGRIVGTLIAGWDGWRGNFYRLAVLPEYRRRGVARALVDKGEEELRARGARRLAAIVVLSRDPAVGFWATAGYEHQVGNGRYTKTIRHEE